MTTELQVAGRVVYEGSNVPAPNDAHPLLSRYLMAGPVSILMDTLSDSGEYSVEGIPLSHADPCAPSPTRTCLISNWRSSMGTGEDMTESKTRYSTTLRVAG